MGEWSHLVQHNRENLIPIIMRYTQPSLTKRRFYTSNLHSGYSKFVIEDSHSRFLRNFSLFPLW